MKRIDQKTVLITGATRGIGLVVARYLARKGYLVYGTARETSHTEALQKASQEIGENLIMLKMDLTTERSIQKAVQTILEKRGKIDVLINNACEVVIGTCKTCLLEEQQRVMDVNYFGVVRMLQAILPSMRANKAGHVINMISLAGA